MKPTLEIKVLNSLQSHFIVRDPNSSLEAINDLGSLTVGGSIYDGFLAHILHFPK